MTSILDDLKSKTEKKTTKTHTIRNQLDAALETRLLLPRVQVKASAHAALGKPRNGLHPGELRVLSFFFFF